MPGSSLGADSLPPLWPSSPTHEGHAASCALRASTEFRLPPAWGFNDSPASSPVGKAPTREWQHPSLGIPSQSAFSKDSPLDGCATCCGSSRQFSVVPGDPSGNASNNRGCGGGQEWVLASLPRPCQTRVPRIRSITHTSAAAALCRVGLSCHAFPGRCTRLYKTEGFLALPAEGEKSEELVTQDKMAPH